jgi:hypothetical protein
VRVAAVSFVVVAIVAVVAVTGYGSKGDAAPAPPSVARAIAEIGALQKAQAGYYTKRARYSERLADLFANPRLGSDIVMNAGGLDIHLDTSTDGKTVIVRVSSPAIALSRVLVRGRETGRTCEALAPGAGCP